MHDPEDSQSSEKMTKWLKRRRQIILMFYRERPIDLVSLVSMRMLPLGRDGGFHERLVGLNYYFKLSPQQHSNLKRHWELYRIQTDRARNRASNAISMVASIYKAVGEENVAMFSTAASGVRHTCVASDLYLDMLTEAMNDSFMNKSCIMNLLRSVVCAGHLVKLRKP